MSEIKVTKINNKLEEIKKRFEEISKESSKINREILDNTTVNELEDKYKELTDKIKLLKEKAYKNTPLNKIKKFLPSFIVKKVGEIKDTFIEQDLSSFLDEIKKIQTYLLEETGKGFEHYKSIYQKLEENINIIDEMIKELEELEVEDKFEVMEKNTLLANLQSFNLINKNNIQKVDMQVVAFNTMKSKMVEMQPIIENILELQLVFAVQNSKLQSIKENYDTIKEVINDFIVLNDANSKAAMMNAVELAKDNIIEKETVKQLSKNDDEFKREILQLVNKLEHKKEELIKEVLTYKEKLAATKSENLLLVQK